MAAAVATVLWLATLGGTSVGAHSADDACSRFGRVETTGSVVNPGLTEISGVVASGRHDGVLWTHNDSGGGPEVFALGEHGADLGTFTVTGASATDWEDIARGPGPDRAASYLYIGDIGDNGLRRDHVTIYRVAEPSARPVSGGTLRGVETITLRYPGGPADAEALLVDPVTGDLLVITKSWVGRSTVLRAPAPSLTSGARITMLDEGTLQISPPSGLPAGLPGTAVTGADISADGSLILVRTYRQVLAFTRAEGQTVPDALTHGHPCAAPQAEEKQGEAVALTRGEAAYVTISEGLAQAVHRAAIGPRADVSTTAAPNTPRPNPTSSGDGRGGGDGGGVPVAALVGGASLVVVLVAFVAAARTRRRRTEPTAGGRSR